MKSALEEAFGRLEEAMRSPGPSSTDPELRRAASRLGELLRSDDAELERFARRNLPGAEVDTASLRALREILRLLAAASTPEAWNVLRETAPELGERLAAAQREAEARRIAEAAAETPSPTLPPAHSVGGPVAPLPAGGGSRLPAFEPAPAPASLPTPPPPADLSVVRWEGPPFMPAAPPALLDETAPDSGRTGLVESAKLRETALPFVESPTADSAETRRMRPDFSGLPFVTARAPVDLLARTATAVEGPVATSALPFVTEPAPPESSGDDLGATVARGRMSPFAAAASATLVLPLEQYAWLVVCCQLYPDHASTIERDYGIVDASARAALDRHWHERLTNEPELAEQWRKLYEHAWQHAHASRG